MDHIKFSETAIDYTKFLETIAESTNLSKDPSIRAIAGILFTLLGAINAGKTIEMADYLAPYLINQIREVKEELERNHE